MEKNRIEEIDALSDKILNEWGLNNAKQLGLQACTIGTLLASEIRFLENKAEKLQSENERLRVELDAAVEEISKNCHNCKRFKEFKPPFGCKNCEWQWRGPQSHEAQEDKS